MSWARSPLPVPAPRDLGRRRGWEQPPAMETLTQPQVLWADRALVRASCLWSPGPGKNNFFEASEKRHQAQPSYSNP